MALQITGDPAADALLERDAFSLLVGMLLDQQFPMERAFAGPARMAERLGVDRLDPAAVAALDPDEFAALCARPPAVHRFPASMAARVQALAGMVVERYGGAAEAIWLTAPSGAELLGRLTELPGFGTTKARIFLALLGKQRGVRPPGWEQAAGDYAEPGAYRSVADVVDAQSLAQVRSVKQAQKAQAKARAAASPPGSP